MKKLLLSIGLIASVWAQTVTEPEKKAQLLDRITAASKDAATQQGVEAKGPSPAPGDSRQTKLSEPPFAPPMISVGQATQEKYEEALREFYQYQINGLQHRQRVFSWQMITSVVILVVVLVLVGAGIYFAAVQFRSSLVPLKDTDGKTRFVPVTELKASLKGIEVSSSILGVIILAISLGFFYLYLVYVYPIHEIF